MNSDNFKNEVLQFLRSSFVMSVATSNGDNPSSAILLYHVDDNFNFYFATHSNSKKIQNLRNNPKIDLSVWEYNQMMVQAAGSTTEIVDEYEKLAIVDKLAQAAAKGADFWPPLFRIKGDEYTVVKVTPHSLRVLDLKQDTMTQQTSPFTEINL